MPKLTIEKTAAIGKLIIKVKDGEVHIEGSAKLTPDDWERISEHLDLSTGEKKHCHCHHYWWSSTIYSPSYVPCYSGTGTTLGVGNVTWTSDTGSEVILTS